MNEWDTLTQREKGIVREAMEFAYENFPEGDKRSWNVELYSALKKLFPGEFGK